MKSGADRLFVALDVPARAEAMALCERVAGVVTRVKIGLELFAAEGPDVVAAILDAGFGVFLDLKLHDIPETVRRAARAAASTGAEWLTVHASGGPAMLRAAVEGAEEARVLAVTVLTSLDASDLEATGMVREGEDPVASLVLRRARLAQEAGCAGVIASPREARMLRDALGPDFLIITPGVRGTGTGDEPAQKGTGDDQKRVATAAEAIAAGASAVVVGRPIRDAKDPRAAAQALVEALAWRA